MRLGFHLKHHFFSAFRELFVHHHGSLEFRAKTFALVIAANEETQLQDCEIIKDIGYTIYNGDIDRSNLLMISTKELVQKVKEKNSLNIDNLIASIQADLKVVPRYAKKIDIQSLKSLLSFTHDKDTLDYQHNILNFLQTTKDEILNT